MVVLLVRRSAAVLVALWAVSLVVATVAVMAALLAVVRVVAKVAMTVVVSVGPWAAGMAGERVVP